MQRNIDSTLEEYFRSGQSRPIMLRGMRGVGKTYTACAYAKRFYSDSIYLNFETDGALRHCFEQASEDSDFLSVLLGYLDATILPNNILIILDEIMSCECAFSILRRFLLKDDLLPIFITNSLNLAYSDQEGIFSNFDLFPMTFDEFLTATGHEWYTEIIRAHFDGMRRIPELVHGELCDLYDEFLRTGGMPSVILDHIEHDDCRNTEELQHRLYDSLISEETIVEHSENSVCGQSPLADDKLRCLQLMSVIPSGLLNKSGKFQFNLIRRGLTYRDCQSALGILSDRGLIIKTDKYTCPTENDPTVGERESFELRYADHGFLNSFYRRSGVADDVTEAELIVSSSLAAFRASGFISKYYTTTSVHDRIYMLYDNSRTLVLADFRLPGGRRHRVPDTHDISSDVTRYILCEDNFDRHDGLCYIPYYSAYCIK